MHNHIKTQTINHCQQKHFAKIRQEGIKDIDKNVKKQLNYRAYYDTIMSKYGKSNLPKKGKKI